MKQKLCDEIVNCDVTIINFQRGSIVVHFSVEGETTFTESVESIMKKLKTKLIDLSISDYQIKIPEEPFKKGMY